MRVSVLGEVLRILQRQTGSEGESATDAQLLRRYNDNRDELAFTELVRRHGPMVLGVCRRLLREDMAAEDAFQATFLVLVRKARALCWQESIAGWLHEVARRVARKARRQPAQLANLEHAMHHATAETHDAELGEVLAEALASLPRHYRTPLLLCCCEGQSNEEAARALGCPVGTVKSRLARGRDLLRKRLQRQGVTVPAAAVAAALTAPLASATVSPALLDATVATAMSFARGTAVRSGPALLAGAVLRGFSLARVKLCLGLCLCASLLFLGAAFSLGFFGPSAPREAPGTPAPVADAPISPALNTERAIGVSNEGPDEADAPPGVDASLETPLPKGAVARLGTTRYRTGEVVGAMKLSSDGKKLITGGPGAGNGLFIWDAVTGKLILRCPFGEEAEISRDGERAFVSEFQPLRPEATTRPPVGESAGILDRYRDLTEGKKVKNALNIYQLSTGKLLRQIEGPSRLAHFAIAPDERTLALEYAVPNGKAPTPNLGMGHDHLFDSHLELYDLKAGRVLHKLGELPRNYNGNGLLRFSADSKTLFVVSCSAEDKNNDSTVRRFDVATGALQSKKTIGGVGWGTRTRLNSAGKALIVSGNTIWDLEKERVHWASKGELNAIITFMPDGRTLIGSSSKLKRVEGEDIDSHLVHWDMEADREIRRLPARFPFREIAADGKTCYGAAWTYRWFRFDFASGKEIDSVDAPIQPADRIAFSPDGKLVATLNSTFSADKNFVPTQDYFSVRVWDRATGKCLHHVSSYWGNMLFFTADSTTLAYGVGGPNILTLDTATGQHSKRQFERLPVANFAKALVLENYSSRLSPDGKFLASPTALWDWTSGKLIGKLEHTFPDGAGIDPTGPFAISPDNKRLICLGYPQKHVQIWSLADRKLISDKLLSDWPTLRGDTIPQFIEGGKLLAADSMTPRPPWKGMLRWPEEMDKPIPAGWPDTMPPMPDAVIHVWDTATGQEKFRRKVPQRDERDLPPLCSPDGKLVLTGNYHDGLVRFWDLASGKEVGQFRCPGNGVYNWAFSPDGGVLAVSAKDTTVLLVDVRKVVSKP